MVNATKLQNCQNPYSNTLFFNVIIQSLSLNDEFGVLSNVCKHTGISFVHVLCPGCFF